MKPYPLILFIALMLSSGCHSRNSATATAPARLVAADSTRVGLRPNIHPQVDNAVPPKTHLRDTTYGSGSFMLFLEPDDKRYAELEKEPDAEISEGDADFGAGISGTIDSIKQSAKFKGITILTSSKRYICIQDCQGGPVTIDRDTVSYGYILSGTGKRVVKMYNFVHSGDYLNELEDYFFRK